MRTMKKGKTTDHKMIESIIAQLSDLSERLPHEKQEPFAYAEPQSSFFFSFDIRSGAPQKDYKRYHEFIDTVTCILNDFGIHIGCNGYSYIVEAVKLIVDRQRYDVRMKSDIYPRIAEKFRITNQGAVEHSIRNAINTAYEDQIKNPKCNMMGMFGEKPTNKRLILHIADKVSMSMCETRTRNAG